MLPEVNYIGRGKLQIWLTFNWQNQLSDITARSYTNKQQTSYSVNGMERYEKAKLLPHRISQKAKAKNNLNLF